jgi:hypothetical protein
MGAEEWAVVILVVGARLVLPFAIPYWPLPAAVACMILDSIDQSIFQQFPAIPLEGYQSYDKSLDIYYLSIMYVATMRNWVNPTAFKASFFLWYYRLVGVVIFELTQVRAVLFIFPNTFEYFWDFVEAVRMRWNTMRMGKWTVILSVAAIWIFIKLPQEYWIHIAQKDMTDAIKELFGVDPSASWSEAISNRPELLVAAIVAVAVLLFVIYWIVTRKAPAGDHGIRLKADPLPPECQGSELYRTARTAEGIFDRALLEKVVLTGLISVIFAQYLLSDDIRGVWVLGFVAVFVVVNAFVSQWLARRGRAWRSVAIELGVMFVVNYGIVGALVFFELVLGRIEQRGPIGLRLFFVFLFTVITVLFDRYRTVFTARGVLAKRADNAG